MSFSDGNGMSPADMSAVLGGNRGMFGNGDGAWWLIILFLFAFMGNWGNNGNGNGAGNFFPWMMAAPVQAQNDVQRGFDQAALMGSLNGITAALANAEVSRCNAQTNVLQTLNTSQAASMQSMNSLAMALQNCCCENRAASADLKYTVATENCADRQVFSDGFRDLTAAIDAKVQTVMDKLCALELDSYKQRNADLLAENNALKFDRSQTAQNNYFQGLVDNAVQRVNPTPIPAYVVQNPACCNQNYYSGCGCQQ